MLYNPELPQIIDPKFHGYRISLVPTNFAEMKQNERISIALPMVTHFTCLSSPANSWIDKEPWPRNNSRKFRRWLDKTFRVARKGVPSFVIATCVLLNGQSVVENHNNFAFLDCCALALKATAHRLELSGAVGRLNAWGKLKEIIIVASGSKDFLENPRVG